MRYNRHSSPVKHKNWSGKCWGFYSRSRCNRWPHLRTFCKSTTVSLKKSEPQITVNSAVSKWSFRFIGELFAIRRIVPDTGNCVHTLVGHNGVIGICREMPKSAQAGHPGTYYHDLLFWRWNGPHWNKMICPREKKVVYVKPAPYIETALTTTTPVL